jgi:hypothetical protein
MAVTFGVARRQLQLRHLMRHLAGIRLLLERFLQGQWVAAEAEVEPGANTMGDRNAREGDQQADRQISMLR